ncbi:MAG: hypothetical protein RSC56_04245 [Acidaminococcaceae bacterium]
MDMILQIIGGLVALAALGFAVIVVYAWTKATDDTKILAAKRTPLVLESMTATEAVFSLGMPLVNDGKEEAAILDVFVRPYLPQEQFDAATVFGHVETADRRRSDNYFEALMLKSKGVKPLIVTLRFVANNGLTIKEALAHMVDMDAAVYYNGLARKDIYIRKTFFTIMGEEIRTLVGGAGNGK